MIAFPPGAKVWLAGGATDMRKGMNGLALRSEPRLEAGPARWESCSAFEANVGR